MYDNGDGVKQDDKEAVKWYRLAAEQGYAVAQCNRGAMYASGDGVPQDFGKALKWWQLAAEQRIESAPNATTRHRRHYSLADLCS